MSAARTGTIDITKNGRHRVRVSLPNGKRPTIGIFDTRAQAEAQRAAIEKETGIPMGDWAVSVINEGAVA